MYIIIYIYTIIVIYLFVFIPIPPQRIPGPIPSKWRQSLEVWQVGHLEPAHLQHWRRDFLGGICLNRNSWHATYVVPYSLSTYLSIHLSIYLYIYIFFLYVYLHISLVKSGLIHWILGENQGFRLTPRGARLIRFGWWVQIPLPMAPGPPVRPEAGPWVRIPPQQMLGLEGFGTWRWTPGYGPTTVARNWGTPFPDPMWVALVVAGVRGFPWIMLMFGDIQDSPSQTVLGLVASMF